MPPSESRLGGVSTACNADRATRTQILALGPDNLQISCITLQSMHGNVLSGKGDISSYWHNSTFEL